MRNRIRLNKISVVETSFPTRITSKGTDYFVNATEQNKQIKINIEETHQLCIPPDYDCNYFLAKGIIPSEIEKYQVGRVTSLGQINQNSKFLSQFEGKITYQIKNGKIARLPLIAYLSIINISNVTRTWPSTLWGSPSPYPESLAYFFPNALNILDDLQGFRPEIRIYPIQNFPDINNVSILGEVINLNTNLNLNLIPKLYKIGDDASLSYFDLSEGNLRISEINWDSSSWNQIVTGFLITLVDNTNPSPSEQLLFYSKITDQNYLETPILMGTTGVTLQIPAVSYRLFD